MSLTQEQFLNQILSAKGITHKIRAWQEKSFLKRNELQEYYEDFAHNPSLAVKLSDQKTLLKLIAEINQDNKFSFFYLKSFRYYPFVDHNLDLVILDKEEAFIEQLLQKGFKPYPNLADIREPWKKFYQHPSTSVLLHLHRQVSWNGIIALDKTEVFARCRKTTVQDVEISIPCPEDHFLIMAAHCLFENYYLNLGEILQLNHLLNTGLDFKKIYSYLHQYHWRNGLNLFNNHLASLLKYLDLSPHQLPVSRFYRLDPLLNFPYYLNYIHLLPFYFLKIIQDLLTRPLNIPRQLFTYLFVGPIWQYSWKRFKKIWRKNKEKS